MSISESVSAQMKQALKAGQTERLRALRMVKAELQVAERSGKDFKEADVLKSYAKSLRKSREEYERLGRPDQAAAMRAELQVVEEFLPRLMPREELKKLIDQLIAELGVGQADIGRLMRELMSRHGEVVDGRLAQQIARDRLAGR